MSFVTYEPQGAVAYLIINRPEALNALNSQVLADLDAALDAIDLDAVRCLIVRGAAENNLRHIDVEIPLGTFTCVTGVSGSGKSSLVNEIIHKKLASALNHA